MQLLGGEHGEAIGEVEAHLVAEYGQRARTRAVGFLMAVIEHVLHQVEILFHASVRKRQGYFTQSTK